MQWSGQYIYIHNGKGKSRLNKHKQRLLRNQTTQKPGNFPPKFS
jgi:hypothetical protein